MAKGVSIGAGRWRMGARRRGVHGAWFAPGQKDDAGVGRVGLIGTS